MLIKTFWNAVLMKHSICKHQILRMLFSCSSVTVWGKSCQKINSEVELTLLRINVSTPLKKFISPPIMAAHLKILKLLHCVKSVQIRSFCWSVFSRIRTENGEIQSISPYSVGIRENRDQKKLLIWTLFTPCFPYFPVFSQNVGKYGPEETYVFGHFSLCEIIGFKASSRNLILVFLQHI